MSIPIFFAVNGMRWGIWKTLPKVESVQSDNPFSHVLATAKEMSFLIHFSTDPSDQNGHILDEMCQWEEAPALGSLQR